MWTPVLIFVIQNRTEVVAYRPPSPPDAVPHRYVFLLLRQPQAMMADIDLSSYTGPDCPETLPNS